MMIYCCKDLIFATKIRATADSLSLPSRPARDAAALQKRLDRVDDGQPNEPVSGVIIDLEMGDDALALVDQIKKHSASIPVVAFGSHLATQTLQAAREHGADFVMPRSVFAANLPNIIERMSGEKV